MARESLPARSRSASSEERDLFLLMLIHDIKSPLSSIVGLLEHAQKLNGSGEAVPEELDELLGLARSESLHLLDLTGDLLELGRLRGAPGPLDLVQVNDLEELVRQAMLDA